MATMPDKCPFGCGAVRVGGTGVGTSDIRWDCGSLKDAMTGQLFTSPNCLRRQNAALQALLDDHGPDGRNVTNAQYVALRDERERLWTSLHGDWQSVYLDGHNEHGYHVLSVRPSAVADHVQAEEALQDQEVAESIFKDAAASGYSEGQFVVIDWSWECGPSPCYERINEFLTHYLFGKPDEQMRKMAALFRHKYGAEVSSDA